LGMIGSAKHNALPRRKQLVSTGIYRHRCNQRCVRTATNKSQVMKEILLNAILNLFSLQASLLGPEAKSGVLSIVRRYLREHLRIAQPQTYLDLFEAAFDLNQEQDRAALLERACAVAAGLKPKLPRLEQYAFLLHLMELAVQAGGDVSTLEVAQSVARELDLAPDTVDQALTLCQAPYDADRLGADFILAGLQDAPADPAYRVLRRPGFKGCFAVWRISEVNALFITTLDTGLSLDSIPLVPQAVRLLPPGAIIRDASGTRVYYSELAALFSRVPEQAGQLTFLGRKVDFRYPGSGAGLHDFSFSAKGGSLVGVIGGSGAGKSTLLSILNGQQKPDSGQVLINGVDLHEEPQRVEGVIGYVPQDDLLFDDLTVFENLYYSARLCLANLSPDELTRRVEAILAELNQLEIRDFKVGSPLDKTISGGQRKRLNIALELIREPSILFVDEPTSGLSSSDSDNVMTLLKSQAAKGKLVITVIHQPSSRIFKMFDDLWILDQGGRPIYDGNPLDALVYFRRAVHTAGEEEYACPSCGNVNPEQVFEIIEEKVVGEGGLYTKERRVSAQEWHQRYLKQRTPAQASPDPGSTGQAERRLWRPGAMGQLAVFFLRNLKSRLANRWYMAINLLEPPLLAVLAALLCRGSYGGEYVFGQNQNLAIYFFISVIVALFLGLSVSAEEINRDLKILQRERFLALSWPSYVAAKTLYLALVSALQMAVYTIIGNTILDIPDLYLFTWLVLFSASMVSCVLGLNVSASIKSAVTIYILIPLLLVPQIMLGGAVVPYAELKAKDAGDRYTPLVADLMPSRWALEALMVRQFTSNDYESLFFKQDCIKRQSDFVLDYYLPEMRGLADYPFLETNAPNRAAKIAQRLHALNNELRHLHERTDLKPGIAPAQLDPGAYNRATQKKVKEYLTKVEAHYLAKRKKAAQSLDSLETRLKKQLGKQGLKELKTENYNQSIARLTLNLQTLEDLALSGDRLVQIAAPVCQEPESKWGQAQFFSAFKKLGPWLIPTPLFNLGVLWFMALALYLALGFSLLPRMLGGLGQRLAALTKKGKA
jgi:ABC-type multidrug transport system ATPase subunit